jgi:hypothetical protein
MAQQPSQPDASREDTSQDEKGKVDALSLFYIFGGIPAIVVFMWLLFALGVRGCGLPA